MKELQGIILAAGRGSRMNAKDKNKVMMEVGGNPMIHYPVTALRAISEMNPIVVVGYARESIQEYLQETVTYAVQLEPLGTADAVKAALKEVPEHAKYVIVLYGDHSTFYTAELLQDLVEYHEKNHAAMTLITTHTDPTGYGRIIRDENGRMIGIVEEKNATEEQRKIREINTGNAIYNIDFLRKYISLIKKNELTGEYYFTDVVSLGVEKGEVIETFLVEDALVGLGVNTPEQLAAAEREMQKLRGNQ